MRASSSSGTPKSRAGASSGRSTCARLSTTRRPRDRRGRIRALRRLVVARPRARARPEVADRSRQGLQPDASNPRRAIADDLAPSCPRHASRSRRWAVRCGSPGRWKSPVSTSDINSGARCAASSPPQRLTIPKSRHRISTASRRGAGCGRARRTACLYVGRTARFANLSIAAGHAMMGDEPRSGDGHSDGRNPRGRIAADST